MTKCDFTERLNDSEFGPFRQSILGRPERVGRAIWKPDQACPSLAAAAADVALLWRLPRRS